MANIINDYWSCRLDVVKKALEANNFEVYMAENPEKAKEIVLDKIIPGLGIKSISWGGSMTFINSGLYHALKDMPNYEIIDVFKQGIPVETVLDMRRKALLSDLYITGTNAVTETGSLVNLDMYGNRVAAITFGPEHVIILVGRNKIVPDLETAMTRIRNYAAPVNTRRLNKKTPCASTSICHDCKSPDRICNYWTVTEKSYPPSRIKIVLINEDMGF